MIPPRYLHPAGRYTTGDRLVAADKLRARLDGDFGLDIDLIEAGELVELVAAALHGVDR